MNATVPPAGSEPDALFLLAPGCAHCPIVLAALGELLKEGRLGRLEAVNIAAHPEVAQMVGTRSVPWVQIGPYELSGVHSKRELAHWAELAAQGAGLGPYFSELLETGNLKQVLRRIRQQPEVLHDLLTLLEDEDTPLAARVGVGAVLEELQPEGLLKAVIPDLKALTRSPHAHTRADACHYLGLTGDRQLIPVIEPLLKDPDAQVREIAADTLAELRSRRS